MRRSDLKIIAPSFIVLVAVLAIHSYLMMEVDKKSMDKKLALVLDGLLVIFLIFFLYFAVKFYKRHPVSLTYRIADLPFDFKKLPIEIQQQIKNKVPEEGIINNIERLFAENTSRTTSLLVAYAYFLYNFGKRVMLDEKDEYGKKALKILQEASQNGEDLDAIAKLKLEVEALIKA